MFAKKLVITSIVQGQVYGKGVPGGGLWTPGNFGYVFCPLLVCCECTLCHLKIVIFIGKNLEGVCPTQWNGVRADTGDVSAVVGSYQKLLHYYTQDEKRNWRLFFYIAHRVCCLPLAYVHAVQTGSFKVSKVSSMYGEACPKTTVSWLILGVE